MKGFIEVTVVPKALALRHRKTNLRINIDSIESIGEVKGATIIGFNDNTEVEVAESLVAVKSLIESAKK